jgi:hypothetical protein
MNFKCLECGKEFENKKSFHLHLKAHTLTIGDYYVQHYGKRDLLTQDLLCFKNYDQYFREDFNSFSNYLDWLKISTAEKAKSYVLEKTKEKFAHKNIKVSPSNLFYTLSDMADIRTCKRLWGSYSAFLKELDIESWYCKSLPNDFWEKDCEDIKIFIDTREKKPFNFINGVNNKLDFGDYTAGGKLYSKTFVDRKAQDDFRQTFGKDIDRFRREMDRCKKFGSYMFVVVEASIEKIEEDNKTSKFKSNLGFLWHNIRNLLTDYPENLQIIFAHSRGGARKLIPKILYYGKDLWHVDLQYFIDNKIYGLEQVKFKISN